MVEKRKEKLSKKLCQLIYPKGIYCVLCGSVIDRTRKYELCDNCIEKFLWITNNNCQKCGKILVQDYIGDFCPDCLEREHYFDRGFTCATYSLYERNLILEYKKRDKSYIGRILGEILYDRIVIENLSVDVIIEVPIHFKKLKSRGYNQAEIMTRDLAQRLGLPYKPRVIKRKRETVSMKKLGVWERIANMTDAFEVEMRNVNWVKGKNVLLVDDIYTTGATVDMCSKALKDAGAETVYVLTFASGGMMVR